ncbi:MAG: hypothetical protein WD491_14640 [Balneolales bacterium]
MFTLVIRAAGERTAERCRQMVLREVPEEDVHVVELVPFEEALRECYRIGMESGKKWMITIDADVLPRRSFSKKLMKLSARVNPNILMYNGYVHDKLLMKRRRAGFRVYNTSHLAEAFSHIPENGATLRPESHIINCMLERGYEKQNFNYVMGIHDYHQYYRDIYRKSFLHASKHEKQITSLTNAWEKASTKDPDFKVAIRAAADGLSLPVQAKTDATMYDEYAAKALQDLGLREKDEMKKFVHWRWF